MKTYIEIIRYEDKECVKRLDVSDKSGRAIDKIDAGMNRNMNHEEFFSKIVDTKKELKVFWYEVKKV